MGATTPPSKGRRTSRLISPLLRLGGVGLLAHALTWVLAAQIAIVHADPPPVPEPSASAQPETSQDDEARRAFQEGTDAAETERWADSERAFRRAYALSRAPSALFNQGVALRALGRHLEARNAFDELLARTDDAVSSDLRESALGLRAESAARVATLTLSGLDLAPHRIRIDGRPVPDSLARPLHVELGEGPHTVEILREGFVAFTGSEELAAGERRTLHVRLEARAGPNANEKPRHRRRWAWIGGSALVVAAGLTTTALLLSRSKDEPLSPRTEHVYEVP